MKINKQHKIYFYFSIGLIILILGLGYYSGFSLFSGIIPCLPPPGVAVDGIALARVYTSLDINGNGIIDIGEPALPIIEIKYPPSSPKTDNLGNASIGMFKPGCVCSCWENEYVEVILLDGYRPTTPLIRELSGDNLLYEFGFIQLNP